MGGENVAPLKIKVKIAEKPFIALEIRIQVITARRHKLPGIQHLQKKTPISLSKPNNSSRPKNDSDLPPIRKKPISQIP